MIGPYQVLPLLANVDLGAMAMKEYSIFHKSQRLEPHHQSGFAQLELELVYDYNCAKPEVHVV